MFEIGGRAGKQGIVYEDRCLSRFLMRLVSEELTTIVVEPKGENTDWSFEIGTNISRILLYRMKGGHSL